jgi:hypothetical protein
MTAKFSIPDFVQDANTKHSGLADEYSALYRLSILLFAPQIREDLERSVLLQCAIAWQHYHAILLLLANGFGVQGLVLCRTLFELVISTLYLLKKPALLTDFLDYGKLIIYQQALAAGCAKSKLAQIKPECEEIRLRFMKGKRLTPWHGGTIRKLAEEVKLTEYYEKFYSDASAAVHSDATKTLSHGARGWKQSLAQFVSEQEADFVRYASFQLVGWLFHRVNEVLHLGHDKESQAVILLVLQRAKSADMPN